MIKKDIYPKTERLHCEGDKIQITEKLDGNNLVIFKLNEEIYIAQRHNVFKITEIEENKQILCRGLYQWLVDHKKELEEEIYDGSAICGEWLGMGNLKYPTDEFDKRYYMFAKARISENLELSNIKYDHNLFIYPFLSQKIPNFIGIVPVVTEIRYLPNKANLDELYIEYTNKVGRKVEGFVVNYSDKITKYVRMKNGKLAEHFDRLDK